MSAVSGGLGTGRHECRGRPEDHSGKAGCKVRKYQVVTDLRGIPIMFAFHVLDNDPNKVDNKVLEGTLPSVFHRIYRYLIGDKAY